MSQTNDFNNHRSYVVAPLIKINTDTYIGRILKEVFGTIENYQNQGNEFENTEADSEDEMNSDYNDQDLPINTNENEFHSDSSYQERAANKLVMLLRKAYIPDFLDSFLSLSMNFKPDDKLLETMTELDFNQYNKPLRTISLGYKVIKKKDVIDNLPNLNILFYVLKYLLIDTRMINKIENFIDNIDFYPVYILSMSEHLSKSDADECRLVHHSRLNNFCPIKYDYIDKEKALTRCCKNVFESSEVINYLINYGKCPICRCSDNVVLAL